MERLIESVATAAGSSVAWIAGSGVLFVVFAAIWALLAITWIERHESVDDAWRRIRHLPLVIQLIMWLLLLPVMLGIWVWEHAAWPLAVRAALVLGIAGWNLVVFLPVAP